MSRLQPVVLRHLGGSHPHDLILNEEPSILYRHCQTMIEQVNRMPDRMLQGGALYRSLAVSTLGTL